MSMSPPLTPEQGANGIHDILKDVRRPRDGQEPVGHIFRKSTGAVEGYDPLGKKVADVLDRIPADKQGRAMDIYVNRGDATHTIHRRKAEGEGTEITIEKKQPSSLTI